MREGESCDVESGKDCRITMEVLIESATLPLDEGEEMS